MNESSLEQMLSVGGHANSLGRANDVIDAVLAKPSRLEELYSCLFSDDAWVRMRAADAFEKICRHHPDWMLPFIDRFSQDLHASGQPSIQWHLAQIYAQTSLNADQKHIAIKWLSRLLRNTEVDWIVAANAMTTLVQFAKDGSFSKPKLVELLQLQQNHKSKSVVRKATKFLEALSSS